MINENALIATTGLQPAISPTSFTPLLVVDKDDHYGSQAKVTATETPVQLPKKSTNPLQDKIITGIAAFSNVVGTLGFVVGSILWAVGISNPGTLTFAVSNVFCGTACTIHGVKYLLTDDLTAFYAMFQNSLACVIFFVCSIGFLFPQFLVITLIGFFTASFLFLTASGLLQIHYKTFWGEWSALQPKSTLRIIPGAFLNTIGSFLFTAGSVCLFYPEAETVGAWLYAVGSLLFFIASWGDSVTWIDWATSTPNKV